MPKVKKIKLDRIISEENVAKLVDADRLEELGEEVVNKTKVDMESRSGWIERNKEALLLAAQVREKKSFPWSDSSNVKYPLITMASIQFHSRASQSLLSAARPVKCKVMGRDPQGIKATRSEMVSKHMSYQVLHEMPHWQDENDRLLLLLAIIGLAYKKTYRCPIRDKNVSELVNPQNLVISYYAKDFETCRKTEIYTLTKNQVLERTRQGIFLDVPLEDLVAKDEDEQWDTEARDKILGLESPVDPTDDATPYRFFDQHFEWDLDGDGFSEPYIITVEESSRKVMRILKRYEEDDIKVNERGEVYCITPTPIFIRFIFIPDVNSPIYGFGLGTLLNPLNDSVNTILNQLIDAGTLSNLQGGFLGRGIRLPKGGTSRFRPGEWKVVQTSGDDLRKGVFPLPVKEPSNVLFQLLGLLIQAGEEISSVADIMKGNNPGQNQPFSTTAAVLEQGMQVFTSIYKRLFRAFRAEYKALYKLNGKYLPVSEWINTLDPDEEEMEISKTMYEDERADVMPEADPDVMSQTQRTLKAESLMEKLMAGLAIDPQEVLKRLLEAEGHEDIPKLMDYEPPPDPEQVLAEQEFQLKRELEWAKLLLLATESDAEEAKDATQGIANLARADSMRSQAETEKLRLIMEMRDKSMARESNEVIAEMKETFGLQLAKAKEKTSAKSNSGS